MRLIRWGLIYVLALFAATVANAENRVALVVGNGAYTRVGALPNPVNDASDIAIALRGLGFTVLLGTDLGHDGMLAKTREFSTLAATSDVALFYYAGHGFQISGTNYLVPTDAAIASPADVPQQTIAMQTVLNAMDSAPGLKLVVLDACRDNPFGAAIADDPTTTDGLARVGTEADFMFVYATQPDNVAYDGTGRNSFFTEAMLSHIYTPGQDISELLINVRRDVLAATGGKQIPWNNSSLTRQFRFDRSPPTASEETLLWQVASNARNDQLMTLYLERYPDGAHRGDVLAFLDSPATRRADIMTDSAAQAKQLWSLARRTRMRPLLEFYLEQYPDGADAAEARLLLSAIPRPEEASAGVLCERLATHPHDATAATAGVEFEMLARNALAAIQACSAAAIQAPELPHYVALLARATAATNDLERAVALYRDAAARSDLRAMVSLAQLYERGIAVEQNFDQALSLYEVAAAGGNHDAQINLAVSLFEGAGVPRDTDRAISLLRQAAAGGSAQGLFNLGVLAQDKIIDTPADALDYFAQAVRFGYTDGYRAGAILLDEGRGVPKDPQRAAELLLRGAAEDDGTIIAALRQDASQWTPATLTEMQRFLNEAGLYAYAIDGISGPNLISALESWRNGGFDPAILDG
ncbi:caspase family protein [Yoonia sediminilitoris]|uniref:Putative caspase-like protein n=1 Tax=Yoonia sediminilitoris TaxID=1286148 RepID=A0A2T6KM46_9RHOB|nr:caspase family protein [Yoonia sediminilitoris]PUB17289.1 putative caspase-like protein [Yoonia sediminilitoris]RCW97584.1 putative caspase-like protein [Yoonia sediminilitoris]